MTGRELIIYILKHNLEDEDIFKNGIFIGWMDEDEIAAKNKVGVSCVRVWHEAGYLNSVLIGGKVYAPVENTWSIKAARLIGKDENNE